MARDAINLHAVESNLDIFIWMYPSCLEKQWMHVFSAVSREGLTAH